MPQEKPAAKKNELRLSDLDLSSVSAGGPADLVGENGQTIIIISLTLPQAP